MNKMVWFFGQSSIRSIRSLRFRSTRCKKRYTSSKVRFNPYKTYCFWYKKNFGQPSFFFGQHAFRSIRGLPFKSTQTNNLVSSRETPKNRSRPFANVLNFYRGNLDFPKPNIRIKIVLKQDPTQKCTNNALFNKKLLLNRLVLIVLVQEEI